MELGLESGILKLGGGSNCQPQTGVRGPQSFNCASESGGRGLGIEGHRAGEGPDGREIGRERKK